MHALDIRRAPTRLVRAHYRSFLCVRAVQASAIQRMLGDLTASNALAFSEAATGKRHRTRSG